MPCADPLPATRADPDADRPRSGPAVRAKPAHRLVDHVGEIELELEAATEEGIFEAALAALAELAAELAATAPTREPAHYEIELEAGDRALLLVDWLSELVFLSEVKQFVPERVGAFELGDHRVRATVEGHGGDPRQLVKAVTLHRLRFEREGGTWHARVVLDV